MMKTFKELPARSILLYIQYNALITYQNMNPLLTCSILLSQKAHKQWDCCKVALYRLRKIETEELMRNRKNKVKRLVLKCVIWG